MPSYVVAPGVWSTQELKEQPVSTLFDLAIEASGSITSQQYLLGRLLVAIEETEAYLEWGLSSARHFGIRNLGLAETTVNNYMRVARQLDELPQLRQATMAGKISYSQVRIIARLATVDTEELWLNICLKYSVSLIRRIAACTPPGGIPGDVPLPPERVTSEYTCRYTPEEIQITERGLAMLSEKEGRPVSFRQATLRFFTELVGKKPYDQVAEKVKKEARRDLQAGHLRRQELVAEVRGWADEMGLLDEAGELRPPGVAMAQRFDQEAATTEGMTTKGTTTVEERATADAAASDSTVSRLHMESLEGSPASSGSAKPRVAVPPLLQPAKVSSDELHFPQAEAEVGVDRFFHSCHPDGPETLNVLLAALNFNPHARHPSKSQRTGLLRRDGYCCSVPGCPNRLWLEIHHIKRYCDGGQTLPDLLVTLCQKCHKNVHEGHLHITGTVSKGLLFTDSAGRNLARDYRIAKAEWLDFWLGWYGTEEDSHLHREMAVYRADKVFRRTESPLQLRVA